MERYTNPPDHKRYVFTGTCGWTDETLSRCGRFFPRSTLDSAKHRIEFYSRTFATVEIDTSTYAIPRPHQAQEWASVVPPGFVFHVKIFGLFTSRTISPNSLPRDIRATFIPLEHQTLPMIKLSQLSTECVNALWSKYIEFISILKTVNKLGIIVFQFPTFFLPNDESVEYIAQCRQRIPYDIPMGIEFRNRQWFSNQEPFITVPPLSDKLYQECNGLRTNLTVPVPITNTLFPTQRSATVYLLRRLNIINIPSDDLAEEFGLSRDNPQPTLSDGRLYIMDDITSSSAAYIRIHRRSGTDRLLSSKELLEWTARIQRMAATTDGPESYRKVAENVASYIKGNRSTTDSILTSPSGNPTSVADVSSTSSSSSSESIVSGSTSSSMYSTDPFFSSIDHPFFHTRLQGPIYFHVGTDWEDQPIINLKRLQNYIQRWNHLVIELPPSNNSSTTSSSTSGNPNENPNSHSSVAFHIPQSILANLSSSGNIATVYNWKDDVQKYDNKRGLLSFFNKPSTSNSSSTTTVATTTTANSNTISSDPSSSSSTSTATMNDEKQSHTSASTTSTLGTAVTTLPQKRDRSDTDETSSSIEISISTSKLSSDNTRESSGTATTKISASLPSPSSPSRNHSKTVIETKTEPSKSSSIASPVRNTSGTSTLGTKSTASPASKKTKGQAVDSPGQQNLFSFFKKNT